jgi:hypothetical protein
MVEVPAETMVIVVPTIVATAVFELVYVIAPSLSVVGAAMEKDASPNVFVIAEKLVITGFTFSTVSVAVVVADVLVSVLA